MIPEEFKTYYLGLTKQVQESVIEELLGYGQFGESLEDPKNTPLKCPHCCLGHVVGNGKSINGVQRYRCRDCNKSFSTTTGKVWYGLHKKDKLKGYMHCLLSGYSIQKSADQVGISLATSFAWRHRLLSSFKDVSSEQFIGVVESDETYFLHSEKGSKHLKRGSRKRGSSAKRDGINDEHIAVIVTMDRQGNKAMKVSNKGRITTMHIQKELEGKVSKQSVFCTDGHPSYAGFAKREQLDHKKIIASKGQRVIDRQYHIQNVNSLDSRLKSFMNKFNGVSTKYLQNYLNWFLALEKVKHSTTKLKTLTALAFASQRAWFDFKDISTNQLYSII